VKLCDQLAGKTVACVMSGGNITNEMLQQVLSARVEAPALQQSGSP
jgi:threonine dehydratase